MGQQGTFWIVDPGDTIYTIATKLNFMDAGDALWNANPDVQQQAKNNKDVLSPGWTLKIPQPDQKTEGGMPVAQQHQFQLPGSHRKLILNLRDQDGNKISDWKYVFSVSDVIKASEDVSDSPIVIDFDADNIDELQMADVVLKVDKWDPDEANQVSDSISLKIGELDPVVDDLPGRIAIQKILANLGYFQGTTDGNFGPDTVAALRSFQQVHALKVDGTASAETCQALVGSLGNAIAVTPPSSPPQGSDPNDLPLGKGTQADKNSVGGRTLGNTYLEPPPKVAADKKTRLNMGPIHLFPPMAYVAPCDKSEPDDDRNIIQMPVRQFAFLDCGRWYNDGRDFGLIWGRHVYLCNYVPGSTGSDPAQNADPSQNQNADPSQNQNADPSQNQNADPSQNQNADPGQNQNADPGQNSDPTQNQSSDPSQGGASGARLDQLFFDSMGASVNVVTYACASWAPTTDFDWDTLYLIIPDTHLMDGPTATVWHELNPYDLKTELDLLEFAKKLCSLDALKDKLRPMQIGDSYDLWVGGFAHGTSDPLFQQNDKCQMVLVGEDNGDGTTDPARTAAACSLLADWVHEIQGVRTPWVSGLLADKRAQIFWAQYSCTQLQSQIDYPDTQLVDIAKQIRDGVLPMYAKYVEDLSQNSTFAGVYLWMFSDSNDSSLDPLNVHQGLDALQQYVQQAMTTAGDPSTLETDLFDGTSIWLNPAEKAFRLMADTFQTKGITYFYGNHDNYFLSDAVTSAAGLLPRLPFLEVPGCLIEHVHRLEVTFSALAFGGGNNFDGEQSGYKLTNNRWDGLNSSYSDYFKKGFWAGMLGLLTHTKDKAIALAGVPVADWFAGQHDQQAYAEEYVDLWLGRASNLNGTAAQGGSGQGSDPSQSSDPSQAAGAPSGAKQPHIFVIGHTHKPKLQYIVIDSSPSTKLGDVADATPGILGQIGNAIEGAASAVGNAIEDAAKTVADAISSLF